MTPATSCPRLFEVEALRNGRLSGNERAHFERHLSQCAACRREAQALESLAAALRRSPAHAPDELHVRRERTRLLAAFDRALVTEPARRKVPLWSALAACAVIAALALVFVQSRNPETASPAPSASSVATAARALVQPSTGAVWTRSVQPGRERMVLTHGTLTIQVTHAANEPGVIVVLPDGELEDTGTTFTVAVENGVTTRVAVQEGSVVLRLRHRAAIALAAGDSWQSSSEPTVPAEATALPPTTTPAPPSSRISPARTRTASEAFREAVSALEAGDNAGAASRFERFLASHPRDARTEDAAYLRVLALKRAGATGAMKAAARDYLQRHPSGFRRREVSSLLE